MVSYLIRCNPSGARRTLSQVKMKHKNILQKANRKKAEARLTGGGPPPPPLTPSEELALSLNKGRPVVAGIPGGTSSHTPCTTSNMVKYTDRGIVLLDPTERTQSVTVIMYTCIFPLKDEDDDEETTSAVTEVDNAGRSTEYIPGDLPTDQGPSSSMHNLSSLPAKELYKVHLQKQIRKSDMEMDLIQLQMEEKRLSIKKSNTRN
ncbi:Copine-2 [Labeo rohita]|uniref:Copine-2 n=1 Tax=Labeo rohita TaxID=84645 RepID=A0ABQ8L705_LABRO|nr:Copine-2 [Labeo rohita]